LINFLKPGFSISITIGGGGNIRQVVFACGVGPSFVMDICAGVDCGDFGTGDQGFGGIGDAAGEGSICGLGAKNGSKGN
jgi:hypothetical protein